MEERMFTPRMSEGSNASRASKNSKYKNLKKFKDVAVESVDSIKKTSALGNQKVPPLLLDGRISAVSAIQKHQSERQKGSAQVNLESARHPLQYDGTWNLVDDPFGDGNEADKTEQEILQMFDQKPEESKIQNKSKFQMALLELPPRKKPPPTPQFEKEGIKLNTSPEAPESEQSKASISKQESAETPKAGGGKRKGPKVKDIKTMGYLITKLDMAIRNQFDQEEAMLHVRELKDCVRDIVAVKDEYTEDPKAKRIETFDYSFEKRLQKKKDGLFRDDMEDEQAKNELVEQFIQACCLLIERDSQAIFQESILEILAKLSIVKLHNIGERCLTAIWDMMKSQSQVINVTSRKVLKSELTKSWNDDSIKIWPWKLPPRVFLVLRDLVLDTIKGNEILYLLFDKVFPSWIKAYLKLLKVKKEFRMKRKETFEGIFELLSVSIDGNQKNFQMFKDRGLISEIALIVKQSSSKSIGYLPLMRLVRSICEADVEFSSQDKLSQEANFKKTLPKSISECAAKFCGKKYEIHKLLAQEIQAKIDNYTHNLDIIEYQEFYGFVPLHTKINDFLEYQQQYESADLSRYQRDYKILAAEIEALGSLLRSNQPKHRTQILGYAKTKSGQQYGKILEDILRITSRNIADPILLTAICNFASELFECDDIVERKEKMEPFAKAMAAKKQISQEEAKEQEKKKKKDEKNFNDNSWNRRFLGELLPYIGGLKYFQLCVMSQNYDPNFHTQQLNESLQELEPLEPDEDLPEDQQIDLFKEQDEKIKQHLAKNDNPIVLAFIKSVINIMTLLGKEASNQQNSNSLFSDLSNGINSMEPINREEALFKALGNPDDEVRVAVVKCFFVIPLEQLDGKETADIVSIVDNITNFAVGKTEIIVSIVFWIFFKFTIQDVIEEEQQGTEKVVRMEQKKTDFQKKYGEGCIIKGLDFLDRNQGQFRIVESDAEDREKYTLSLSILNFIKAASTSDIMKEYLRDKEEIFKQILKNEDFYSSNMVKTCPIDIENSFMGQNMSVLLAAITGVDAIVPYCDVALRVLIRIADVLMLREPLPYHDLNVAKSAEQNIDSLINHQDTLYSAKKNQETQCWIDLPKEYLRPGKNFSEDQIQNYTQQHYIFTKSNGVSLLKIFLTLQNPENQAYLNDLSDPTFHSSSKHTLRAQINEQKSLMEQQFSEYYMDPKLDKSSKRGDGIEVAIQSLKSTKIRKYELQRFLEKKQQFQSDREQLASVEKAKKQFDLENQETVHKLGQREQEIEKIVSAKMTEPTNMIGFKELKRCQAVQDGQTQSQSKGEKNYFNRSEIQTKLELDKYNEIFYKIYIKEDKLDPKESLERKDGFLNKEIRNLTVAAYLRCLIAAIEYAPEYDLRQDTINNIKEPTMFRTITQLCDTTDWDEKCLIGAKYLKVMRYTIQMPFEKGKESEEMLMHYELMGKVIEKCIAKCSEVNQSNQAQREGQIIQNYETAITLFTIVQQVNNFEFSNKNILFQHLRNEASLYFRINLKNDIERRKKKKAKSLFGSGKDEGIGFDEPEYPPTLGQDPLKSPWDPKCIPQKHRLDGKDPTLETFEVNLFSLRKHQSIQEKIVEYMILQIVSKESIFGMIDILFNDMKGDYQKLEYGEVSNDDQEETIMHDHSIDSDDVSESQDSQKSDCALYLSKFQFGMNQESLDEYINLKGLLTIELVRDIIGLITATCAEAMEFEIFQYIMKGVIYQQQRIRPSFVQEILSASNMSKFKRNLEIYLNDNQLTVERYYSKMYKKKVKDEDKEKRWGLLVEKLKNTYERIINLNTVDINDVHVLYSYKTKELKVEKSGLFKKKDYGILEQELLKFRNRIMAITNNGIQILKALPQSLQCKKCPPDMFCPRGPVYDFCIKFQDIETVINFPNLPQKLVIFYKVFESQDNNNRFERRQLTINMTKCITCSTIFTTLTEVMKKFKITKQVDQGASKSEHDDKSGDNQSVQQSQKDETGSPKAKKIKQQDDTSVFKGEFQLSSYLDPTVNCDLVLLLNNQLEEPLNQQEIHDLDLLYVNYVSNSLEPQDFYDQNIKTEVGDEQTQLQRSEIAGIESKFPCKEFDIENELVIQNMCAVCFIAGRIIIMKENWANWKFQETLKSVRAVKLQIADLTYMKRNKAFKVKEPDPNSILKIVSNISMDDVETVNLQRNLQNSPSVEIIFKSQGVEGVQEHQRMAVLQFMGDMERQMFMDNVIDHVDSRWKINATILTSHAGDDSQHYMADEDDAEAAEKKDEKLGEYIAKFNQFN